MTHNFNPSQANKDHRHKKYDENFKVELYFRPDDVIVRDIPDDVSKPSFPFSSFLISHLSTLNQTYLTRLPRKPEHVATSVAAKKDDSVWTANDLAKRLATLEQITSALTIENELLRTQVNFMCMCS